MLAALSAVEAPDCLLCRPSDGMASRPVDLSRPVVRPYCSPKLLCSICRNSTCLSETGKRVGGPGSLDLCCQGRRRVVGLHCDGRPAGRAGRSRRHPGWSSVRWRCTRHSAVLCTEAGLVVLGPDTSQSGPGPRARAPNGSVTCRAPGASDGHSLAG